MRALWDYLVEIVWSLPVALVYVAVAAAIAVALHLCLPARAIP